MDRVSITILVLAVPALPVKLLFHVAQLTHQVVPLTNAHVVQKFALHPLAKRVAGKLIAGIFDVIPQLER